MTKDKTKVYIYTRVSTTMQIDGFSLEAQKTRMKAFCDYNDFEIVGEYEDAGKSGKSIEGRLAFTKMIDDIKLGKEDVSDKHYSRKKEDLQKRLYDIYDSFDEIEAALNEARKKRHSIAERKTSADNVYKSLIYFDKLIDKLNEEESRIIIV